MTSTGTTPTDASVASGSPPQENAIARTGAYFEFPVWKPLTMPARSAALGMFQDVAGAFWLWTVELETGRLSWVAMASAQLDVTLLKDIGDVALAMQEARREQEREKRSRPSSPALPPSVPAAPAPAPAAPQ